MPLTTNANLLSDVIAQEQQYPTRLTRETVTIASATSNNLQCGQVLGRITANGKYTAWSPTANDGSENAVAILLSDVDARTADKEAVALVRGSVRVVRGALNFGTATTAQINSAIANLKTLGIVITPSNDVYNY